MCYESLVDGEVTEQSLGSSLRAEFRDALKNGVVAAVIVAAVLTTRGVDPVITAVAATGALVLGAVVHQLLLVVATVALRVRAGASPGDRTVEVAGQEG
jgi:hypothetical protein